MGVEVEVEKRVVSIGARVSNPISGGIGRCGCWCLICGFAIVERGDVASVFALITDACNEEWSKAVDGIVKECVG
ncbi:hypothetical protein QL285_082520 [Trifolium repens]|nr:hypothetical protein QL285_082520 [Trifolium repens]